MRIKSIHIENHPALGTLSYNEFDLATQKKDIATFFVGANGSGKSYFLEALVEIFQTITDSIKPSFDFRIKIAYRKDEVEFIGSQEKNGYTTSPEIETNKLSKFIPENIIFYYSGETKRASDYFKKNYESNKRKLIAGEPASLPAFFYINPNLLELVLLTLFIYEPNYANHEVWKSLDINVSGKIVLKFNEQNWYVNNIPKKLDANEKFWGVLGSLSNFCDTLYEARISQKMKTVNHLGEEYDFVTELTIDPKDFSLIRDSYKEAKDFFDAAVNLVASDLLESVEISIKKKGAGSEFLSKNLSEGERQFLLVMGFIRLTQKERTLFLIDEPDTHLNPLWKYDYMKNLTKVVKTNPEDIELFICSHDPLLISGLEAEQVVLIKREEKKVSLTKASESLMGKGVEAILTSELFGLATTLDYKTNQKIIERRQIMAKGVDKKLNKKELKRLETLTTELKGIDFTLPYNDPAFIDYLASIEKEKFTSYTHPFNQVGGYELRQKVKNLFK